MADFTPEEEGPLRAESVVFGTWLIVIVGGLAAMITIPLMGR
jgi:hypothetical protein